MTWSPKKKRAAPKFRPALDVHRVRQVVDYCGIPPPFTAGAGMAVANTVGSSSHTFAAGFGALGLNPVTYTLNQMAS